MIETNNCRKEYYKCSYHFVVITVITFINVGFYIIVDIIVAPSFGYL